MLEWSKDEDFWVRRIAIDHQLCRKEKPNTKLLEAILVNNFGSNKFFIDKAIGWSLRDYSKTNPELVIEFVEKCKDKMDKLSIKEASKYIELAIQINDGNKRASVIFANHFLISNGEGLLVIPENKVPEFKKMLVAYYEDRDNGEILEFMKKYC